MNISPTNYHLVIDDKFIDDFAADALAISGNNKFVFTFSPPSKHIKKTEGIEAPYGSQALESVLRGIKPEDKVYIHWFSPKFMDYVHLIPAETNIYLFFWGGDFLDTPNLSYPKNRLNHFLFDPLTLAYFNKKTKRDQRISRKKRNTLARENSGIKNIIATHIQNIKLSIDQKTKRSFNKEMNLRKSFLERVHTVYHWNPFDIEILNDLYEVSLKSEYFVYGVGTDTLGIPTTSDDQNASLSIWLGNSDTETNNHLDALELLSKWKDQDIQIVCPLNYGNKAYAKEISDKGKLIFGEKFKPILDFIPREEYYAIMDSVDIAYMPHNRGQAGGNLFAFIKKGKRVFMKEESSIYKLFKSFDIQIETSKDLSNQTFDQLKQALNSEQIAKNIEALNQNISNEKKRIDALKQILLDT